MLGSSEAEYLIPTYQRFIIKNKEGFENYLIKYQKMQDHYLDANRDLYSEVLVGLINRSYDALFLKSLFSLIHLEENWTMRTHHTLKKVLAQDELPQFIDWTDVDVIIFNMFLEAFLLQTRSLLDYYMRHICYLLGNENVGLMNTKNFYKHLRTCDEIFKEKADQIKQYFDVNVFEKSKWGGKIRKWSGVIKHGQNINMRYKEDFRQVGKIPLQWPALEDIPFFDFCQSMSNGFFEMIVDTSEILFSLKWQSGPHNLMKF